jgi:hypothetical protein
MKDDSSLFILWTSGDRHVALDMVFMYAGNSLTNGLWSGVELCIWGPSASLAAEDEEIRIGLLALMEKGVIVTACKACTDNYGITEKLIETGVDVKYMGSSLTEVLGSDRKILTF